jgi:uncharacterized repeat protein (TIGR03843 family)
MTAKTVDFSDATGFEVGVTSEADLLQTLREGRIEERGLLPYSSNHSFLVVARRGSAVLPAVYKPQRGESPLWDFEWGTLCKREAAAYVVSRALTWNLVPPTVLRQSSRGLGSVQLYVEHDANEHYFTVQPDARFALALRKFALFDFVTNNADRKSGHCLVGSDQRLWAIDHGVCFHTDYKLRTVIWEFSGEEIPGALLDDLDELRMSLMRKDEEVTVELCRMLNDVEQRALLQRVQSLLKTRRFPSPLVQRRNYPWPPI